eukprot:TRINITY_DN130_c0_g1_i2.p1 TRINITY_DN130_c0_g1~~TRINITY_DN130_c0_g1_i2.p1  ORF type:complete len:592 (-),score=153.93 TRINITY_DN130_c0_g1_i2:45-1784(-)
MQQSKVLLGLLLLSAAASCVASLTLKNTAPACITTGSCASSDWRKGDHVDGSVQMWFGFAVKNKNMDRVRSFIEAPADTDRWMTRDEVRALTFDADSVATLRKWMRAAGFVNITVLGSGFVNGTVPASAAELLFGTRFYNFTSRSTNRTIQRALSYSLSDEIADLLDFVEGTVQFPSTLHRGPIVVAPASASAATVNQTTPALLNKFYSITSNTVQSKLSTQSLFETLGQSYSPSDLSEFEKQYDIPSQDCVTVIGPNTPADCKTSPDDCTEANLDVQYIIAVAQGAPTTYWSISKIYDYSDPFLQWALDVEAAENPPYVHSISYDGDENANDHDSEKRVDEEVTKLLARGLTVMVSSGDDGVGGTPARSSAASCGFNPQYPGQLPHVVSVGATMGPEYSSTEIACTSNVGGLITTGGGFSNLFETPDYQTNATAYYIAHGPNMPPASAKWNSKGRGYPDVAMLGHNYLINAGGKYYEVSGTSASTPVFAGVVSLVNGMRLAAGKKTLGFLNPTLYTLAKSHPEAFNDVKDGENNCAAGNPRTAHCCEYGFTATGGWDPLTGLGSINFNKLAPLLLALA